MSGATITRNHCYCNQKIQWLHQCSVIVKQASSFSAQQLPRTTTYLPHDLMRPLAVHYCLHIPQRYSCSKAQLPFYTSWGCRYKRCVLLVGDQLGFLSVEGCPWQHTHTHTHTHTWLARATQSPRPQPLPQWPVLR